MFNKDDQAALEAAKKIIANQCLDIFSNWLNAVKSGQVAEAKRLDALISLEIAKNNVLKNIERGQPVRQRDIDLLLGDASIKAYWAVIVKYAPPASPLPPVSSLVAPCFVYSKQQLMALLQTDNGRPSASK